MRNGIVLTVGGLVLIGVGVFFLPEFAVVSTVAIATGSVSMGVGIVRIGQAMRGQ